MANTVAAWWAELSDADREALRLCKRSKLLVEWVEADGGDDDADALYDYLVNHEVYLVDPPPLHICSAEPAAREAIRRRVLPSAFRCPRRDGACPMRALLDRHPGTDVRFTIARGDA
jgi:hypothetical protein